MNTENKHIEERIQAYLDGKLNEEEINALWAEFLKNPEWLDHLEINAHLKEVFQDKMNSEKSAKVHTLHPVSKYSKWVAALAAVILLTIAINLFGPSDHPTMISSIDQINMLEMETVEVTRNEAEELTGADSLLFYAYDASVRSNTDHARYLYDQIDNRYPESIDAAKARLNKGILSYNNRDYEEAIAYFWASLEIGHNDEYVQEKAHWYLANAYINEGLLEDARIQALEAYNKNGVYRTGAYHLLRKLNLELGFEDSEMDR